ncbi:2OG-Fe(II) oxygenase [Algihabitans sp.]|uniref:2OG-Fe(II) oxygenase n=1 Tax=Algihabitans sp. TaxID=2821514 RepID=UPI003BAA5F32
MTAVASRAQAADRDAVASGPIDWAAIDWTAVENDLNAWGAARLPNLLNQGTCRDLAALYDRPELFRSRIVMRRHGFGEGEYQYFAYPLPPLIAELRRTAYPPLASIANRWRDRLGEPALPEDLESYLADCHAAGQVRPTPLLLKYQAGDYNRLHQDLYGAVHFPLQMAILLSQPGPEADGGDFEGGTFLLTEQRPRSQSRAEVVPLAQGDAVIFPVRDRPAEGQRGPYRLTLRHGVSRLTRGQRLTLGIIFHDAA